MTPTYRNGILSDPIDLNAPPKRGVEYKRVHATPGIDLTHTATGIIGALVEWTDAAVVIRDDSGRDHRVRNYPGAFRVNNTAIELVQPQAEDATTTRTASGAISSGPTKAKVARASRIYVEGVHDAALIEKVWGDEFRELGIVVEPIHGADDLKNIVNTFRPGPTRRLGILLDHYVENTKETRIAEQVDDENVLICGHKFVDIWTAVSPSLVGLDEWPDVPRDIEYKIGICAYVQKHGTISANGNTAAFFSELLGRVTSYKDLNHTLSGSVERLIDFVAEV